MYTEILQHCTFCRNFCRQFKGRETLLEKAKQYIQDHSRSQPFVMYGPSGSGKSCVIAKVATMVSIKLEKPVPLVFFD
jgi:hypothetical protein